MSFWSVVKLAHLRVISECGLETTGGPCDPFGGAGGQNNFHINIKTLSALILEDPPAILYHDGLLGGKK